MRAELLATVPDDRQTLGSLDSATHELAQATIEPRQKATLTIGILDAALQFVQRNGAVPGATVGGVAADELSLRRGLEGAYRDAAALADERSERVRLVDQANAVRARSLT